MSTPPSPAYLRAVELLSDGEWHEYGRIVTEVGKVFPPGEATRHVEYLRQRKAVKQGYPVEQRSIPRSHNFLVASGQRALATKVLNNKTRFETKTEGSVRFIRLIPVRPHWRKREAETEEAS